MNFEVVEVEREKRPRNIEAQGKSDRCLDSKFTGSSNEGANSQGNGYYRKPFVGMEFTSKESAKDYYDTYARLVGFSTHVGQCNRAKPDGSIVSWEFACSREVYKRKNVKSCNAMLSVEKKNVDSWVVTKFVEEHNHSTMSPCKVHYLRPRKHCPGVARNGQEMADNQNDVMVSADANHLFYEPNIVSRNLPSVEASQDASMESSSRMNPAVSGIASAVEGNHATMSSAPLVPQHFIQHPCRRTVGRHAQNLLTYFRKMQAENPGFYYAIQLDSENRLSNVFWADARSRAAYRHFGDMVIFDTTYRPSQFQVPLAPFTGVNNHGQMILFGCALLMDESEASFAWVFETWLSAMSNRPPVSITTDQDRAMKAAVHQVFPETRHCICKWHILREGQERLSSIYIDHPSFYGEFYSCINFSETIEDFESSWGSILDKYSLLENDWLQAVYSARKQWAPVYFRNTFFAAISSNHGTRSFFDGYVNQQTTVPMFFKQYERALEDSLEKEIQADYDTMCTTPVLKTPSPMEQQAANLYTKKIFSKFQDELVETFVYTANKIDGDGTMSRFRVAKYEHDHKEYIVTLDVSEMKAWCSCLMFEYSGVLCRHILTVFTVTNVLTVPHRYILKRWTHNAKAVQSDGHEENAKSTDSLTSRFNSLCCEALKFAEEGAISTETFNAAMECLREGARNIEMVKKNVSGIKLSISQGIRNFQDNGSNKQPTSTSDMIPSLWPWQDNMQNQFNLNDSGGANATDLNQPTMSHVVINRDGDGSLTNNSVVRTCFSSMKWVIERKNPESKMAVINLKLLDYGKAPIVENEVQFRLTRVTLEPMLKSMTYINQQLSPPANKVAVINLKLQDTKTTTGETEVKFRASRDALGSVLRSLAFIREQL